VCRPIGRDVNCPRDLSARHARASIVGDIPKGDSHEPWRENGFLRVQIMSGPRPPALFRCRKPQRSPPRSRYHVEQACIHLATGLATGLFAPRLITAVHMATSAAGTAESRRALCAAARPRRRGQGVAGAGRNDRSCRLSIGLRGHHAIRGDPRALQARRPAGRIGSMKRAIALPCRI
jgi:hypothetical protein